MTRSGDPRLLRGLLSHRVLVLSNTLARAAARHYSRRFGVRLAEWRVIDALHAGRGITANQISQWLHTDKAWVGRSVERLIAGGYVRRRPDPEHGRRLLLTSRDLATAIHRIDPTWNPPDSTIAADAITRACADSPEGGPR